MKHINDLTEDCLILLFTQFSLQEQLEQLRPVCLQWSSVIEEQIFARKRILKLFARQGDFSTHLLIHSKEIEEKKRIFSASQNLKPKDNELIGLKWTKISPLFPSIEELVYYGSFEQFECVTTAWPNIRNLTIGELFSEHNRMEARKEMDISKMFANAFDFHGGLVHDEMSRLVESLNTLNKLKHLCLTGLCRNYYRKYRFANFSQILNRLESFEY